MTYRRVGSGTYANQDDIRPATTAHQGMQSAADKAKQDAQAVITSVASPLTLAAGVLGELAATTVAAGYLAPADFDKLHNWPKSRLAYTAAADLMSATAIAATTYVQVVPNQNFTVNSATAFLLILVRLGLYLDTTGAGGNVAAFARALIDSGGTPQGKGLAPTGGPINTLVGVGGGAFVAPALVAGTHTIKIEVYSTRAVAGYCRASSVGNQEFAAIDILEVQP